MTSNGEPTVVVVDPAAYGDTIRVTDGELGRWFDRVFGPAPPPTDDEREAANGSHR